jgi:hypothetical protein
MSLVRLVLNILWILAGGLWMAAAWLIAGVLLALTIVGLPWARAAFNIAGYTLLPFGYRVVRRDAWAHLNWPVWLVADRQGDRLRGCIARRAWLFSLGIVSCGLKAHQQGWIGRKQRNQRPRPPAVRKSHSRSRPACPYRHDSLSLRY